MTMVEMESEDGPETGTPPDDESPADFHLVALGASAGGLQSLCRFFDHVSAEPTAAYVVLMHLAPDRASNLVHILSDHAPLPVQEIEDGDPIATGHVYVPPPGMKLTVEGDRFRIAARERPTEHLIDALFTSVADAWKEKTIGIVLSGSGTDGTWGVSAIREEGGFTLAEDPRHAQFGEMPRSAVETTHVDVVDDPEALAREVTRYLSFDDGDVRPEPRNVDLRRILAVVKEQTGRDFQGYKVNTIRRRIGRRMRLRHCDEVSDYLDLIQEDDAELRRLVRDLLITVTQLFRDPDAFEKLRETAVRDILDRKSGGDSVRIWVPGCSSGEEAYSLAFVFLDEIRERETDIDLMVFATDLDEVSLQTGRAGTYPAGVEADVPPSMRERYVHPVDDSMQVNKAVRNAIIFSSHDLIQDPPFAHMDLVSCRNLLIYLDPELQKRVLTYLHYALEPDGYLFLGTSESILGSSSLFHVTAKKEKIFRKIPGARPTEFRFPTSFRGLGVSVESEGARDQTIGGVELSRIAERALAKWYAPPGVLLNLEHEAVYYFGDMTPLLRTPPGLPDRDIQHLIRPELSRPLRRVVTTVETEGAEAAARSVPMRTLEGERAIRIVGHPVPGPDGETAFLLVVFESGSPTEQIRPIDLSEDERSAVEQLEKELGRTRDDLRSTAEHKDAVNEELRSANEELISMNEELQSTNEELETAKEELQSMNEELETVNSELSSKIAELARANANMENLLAGTEIATIFLDTALCIKSYTRPATELFKLISSDRGRPLLDVVHSLHVEDLETPMRGVLRTLRPYEETVPDDSGRVYVMRILPYRTAENVIDGVVVTFIEVTELKRAEAEARRLVAVMQASKDAVIVVDDAGVIEVWNRGATETYGYGPEEAVGMRMERLIPEADREWFKGILEEVAAGEGPTELESRRATKDGRVVEVESTLTAVGEAGARKLAFTERDVTHKKASERHRELLLRELDHRVKNTIATVEAIAERTIINSGHSMDDFADALRGRIRALGETHKALSERRWEGIHLRELVERTLAPFSEDSRTHIEGRDVVLPVDLTLPLAMALHELVTNAVKYGSLSTPEGSLGVSWIIEETDESGPSLRLVWTEEGGPPVSEPEETGYGMIFLERGIAYEVGGSTEVHFGAGGLVCRIEIPLPVHEDV